MAFLQFEAIKQIHIEITNRCNAACPMCARNRFGVASNPNLASAELSFDDCQRIFDKDLCAQVELVMFCGCYGDPIVANATLPTIQYLKENGVDAIEMFTNGSARDEKWWRELGTQMTGSNDRVVFSIDGLANTNHLYRKGTNFEKIMCNVRAYIGAGGKARWDFLVFQHNQHQIETAQKLATEMGFVGFRLRKTSRFSIPHSSVTSFRVPVYNKWSPELEEMSLTYEKGMPVSIEPDYWLEQPDDPALQNNDSTEKLQGILKDYSDFDTYLNTTTINCIYKNKFQRLFIGPDAKLWPCSYFYGDLHTHNKRHRYREDSVQKVLDVYGHTFNDLRQIPLKEILEHRWFAEYLTDSWSNGLQDKGNPRLLKCARTCGERFSPILSQTQDVALPNIKA